MSRGQGRRVGGDEFRRRGQVPDRRRRRQLRDDRRRTPRERQTGEGLRLPSYGGRGWLDGWYVECGCGIAIQARLNRAAKLEEDDQKGDVYGDTSRQRASPRPWRGLCCIILKHLGGPLLWKLLTRIVRVGPARDGEAEGEGRQNGDAVVSDITPLQRISINKML